MIQNLNQHLLLFNYEFKIRKILSIWEKIKNRENKKDFLIFHNYVVKIDLIIKTGILFEAFIFERNTPNFPGKRIITLKKTAEKMKFFSLAPVLKKIDRIILLKFS
jgi:hypothetical protein